MTNQLPIDKIIKNITDYFPNCQAIYLFGSATTKYFNKTSDVDIAVLLPFSESKKNKNFIFSDLQQKLIELLKAEVDLINLKEVSTAFQKEIISSGKCIFYKNLSQKAEFEGMVFSFYQKLNEERREILNDFLRKNVK